MKTLLLSLTLAIIFLSLHGMRAQQPTPPLMVVQAATNAKPPIVPTKSATPTSADNSSSLQAAVKALQQAKAANAETLKHQEAMLQQLDDLQKAAEQLKIFAKRG